LGHPVRVAGIIGALGGMGAEILDLITQSPQLGGQVFLHLVAGVVRGNWDALCHDRKIAEREKGKGRREREGRFPSPFSPLPSPFSLLPSHLSPASHMSLSAATDAIRSSARRSAASKDGMPSRSAIENTLRMVS